MRVLGNLILVLSACLSLVATAYSNEGEDTTISRAEREPSGILAHRVESPDQSAPTQILVLLPPEVAEDATVVYVLPVEEGRKDRYGSGLREIQKHRLHEKFGAIFVMPTFADLPWYADHAENAAIRQETYFLQVVVPFIERTYAAGKTPEKRLLLGFSKSGWGAWSLLLRHPELFGRAAAWDAPMMMRELGRYGTGPIFGTQENFERYRIVNLVGAKGVTAFPAERLILTGYGSFRRDHQAMHALLDERGIAHTYRDGPQLKHDWHSGWVPEAVELLLRP